MTLEVSFASTSFSQQRLWFFDQLQPGSPLYNIQAMGRLSGRLNIDALQQTLNEIIRRHQVLRTVFRSEDGQPIQVILPPVTVPLSEVDLRGMTDELRNFELLRAISDEFRRPFDLERGPLQRVTLVRLGDEEQCLVLTVHHIVFDGWSVGVFFRELTLLYESFRFGRQPPLAELPLQYAEFAMRQRARLQDKVLEAQLAYWQQQLRGAPSSLDLPTDRPRPTVQTFCGAIRPMVVAPSVAASLREVSQSAGITLFMTLLSAFAVLLHRYSGQEDLIIGTPIANRQRPELELLIGFFVNTLVLRIDISGDPTFLELTRRTREVALGAYAHQDVPFEKLVEELRPDRDPSRNPLFQIMFVFQNAMGGGPAKAVNTTTTLVPEEFGQLQAGVARFDLTLMVTDLPPYLHAALEYNTDLFDVTTIDRMAGHFETLLAEIALAPNRSVSELQLLTAAEHQQLVEWNDTKADYPITQCIHELFEQQAIQRPDAVALTFEGSEVTYAELNAQANRIANRLKSVGVTLEVRIGICLERSVELVTALLGVLKAGGAVVPLDPAYPEERLAFMLKDSEVPVVLTKTWLRTKLRDCGANVICLDEPSAAPPLDNGPLDKATPRGLAYVIYTSGSTGVPKGVLVEHGGLCNVIAAQVRAWQVAPDSRVLQFASFSFDAAMSEIFMALTAGACLCLARQEELLPGPPLARTLQAQAITTVTLTPSVLAALPTEPLPDLRTIIVAGEACNPALAARWAHERKLFNAYGPTEATICATFGQFDQATGRFPIGRPVANTQVYLLDSHGNPVPIGVKGEIHIGGIGVARGYLNQSALTELRFSRNCFVDDPCARLYRTGDMGRYTPDGNLEFLGRVDQQVKIRGFRIELAEIESVLRQHPQVGDAVVEVADSVASTDLRLLAYVVNREDGAPSVPELRTFLLRRLPDYMVPTAFVILADLPRTPSGKVDRRALPVRETSSEELNVSYAAPRTEIERNIAAVWQELLGIERVGLNDNFFDLGGHSLLLVQVHDRLRDVMKINLSLVDLFRHPTINSLAESLGQVEKESTLLDRAEERIARQMAARVQRRWHREARSSD